MPVCLVIEDHGDTRDGYVEFLGFSGFSVLSAAGSDEMHRLLAEQVPDVIVMDLQLPDVDGWALIRELRSSEATRHIPVLVVSARVKESDQLEARKAGADAFITKPCDPDHVVTELYRLLGERR